MSTYGTVETMDLDCNCSDSLILYQTISKPGLWLNLSFKLQHKREQSQDKISYDWKSVTQNQMTKDKVNIEVFKTKQNVERNG